MSVQKPSGNQPIWKKGTRKMETVQGDLYGMNNPGYKPKKGTKVKSN